MTRLKTILYTSQLSEQAGPSVVGAITKTARANNGRCGICGLLIFDGVRFAQMLQGPATAIDALLAKLRADRRHIDMAMLVSAERECVPRFAGWDLGLLMLDDAEPDGIVRLAGVSGAAAEAAFLALAAGADRGAAAPATTRASPVRYGASTSQRPAPPID